MSVILKKLSKKKVLKTLETSLKKEGRKTLVLDVPPCVRFTKDHIIKMTLYTKKMDEEEAIKTFFGTSLKNTETLIVTPIDLIYQNLKQGEKREYSGWWNCFNYGKNTMCVRGPICTHIEDLLIYLPQNIKKVIFLGFCGSLKKELKIGDIVSCGSIFMGRERIICPIKFKKISSVNLYQVKTIHEQSNTKKIKGLMEKGVDCLDMESYSFSKTCKDKKIKFGCIYVVTDSSDKPFYKITAKDIKKIKNSSNKMCKIIRETLI